MLDLFGANEAALSQYFSSIKQPSFRANQLIHWFHQKGNIDFSSMANIPASLRSYLTEHQSIQLPLISKECISEDGVIKWLLKLKDGNIIETVFIPEQKRGTLCISSQVGCYLNCSFCATALQGFNRNLESGEILSQLWLAIKRLNALSPDALTDVSGNSLSRRVSNVVFMGMGEPLLNLSQIIPAIELMQDDNAYGLSKYKLTVSTAGVIPGIIAFANRCDASLAVSLHSPINSVRSGLIPLNKKYPIEELMNACRQYISLHPRRHVLFEYVMLDQVNDDMLHARLLIKLLADFPSKVNLIPFNPYPGLPYQASPMTVIEAFQARLRKSNINTTIRKTRGEKIQAACGQLSGVITDRTKRQAQVDFQTITVRNPSKKCDVAVGD